MLKVSSFFLRLFIASCLVSAFAYAQSSQPELWWWQSIEADNPSNVAAIKAAIDRGVGYGYTGVAFWESTFSAMGSANWDFDKTGYVLQVVNYARSKGLKTIAPVAPYGYSDNVLKYNFNWAEGQHVIGSQFTVNASRTQLERRNSFSGLVNPGFESKMSGWFDLENPALAIDTTVFHNGSASGVITNASGNALFHQVVNVIPWRQYHIRYWVKTRDFSGDAIAQVWDPSSGLSLYSIPFYTTATQDWTAYDLTFNSRTTTQPGLYFGVCGRPGGYLFACEAGSNGGSKGSIWFDDISMEETSLVYVLRRPGAPLSIYNPNNPAKVYQEGRDVSAIIDPNFSNNQGFIDQYHTPAVVRLPPTTSLEAGQTVAMDYYAVVPVRAGGHVGMCLTDPGAERWLKGNARVVTSALARTGTGYLLYYDELRHMNSCASCKAKNLTSGQLLGWHIGQTYNMFHSFAPEAQMYVWNDMFDPYHDAGPNYYYVEGDLAGSWTGLPPQITIMNWNLDELTKSLEWFAGMNTKQPTPFRQIIAGYYDSGNGATAATKELAAAHGIPGVAGLMFTTWYGDYSQLQAFAEAARSNWPAYISSLAADVSAQVNITQTEFARHQTTGYWASTLTLKNTGASSIAGPLKVILTSLTAGVTMTNSGGIYRGSPYITVSTDSLAPGASVSVSIQFTNPSAGAIGFTPLTYSGGR